MSKKTFSKQEIKMNFKKAVKKMATGEKTNKTIQTVFDEVEPLCKTSTDDSTLWDWLSEGDYTGNETPASIAREWDELSEQ